MIEVGKAVRTVLMPAMAVTVLLMGAVAGSAAAADFRAGWEAYQRGDFKTALTEWQPLAENGHVSAQFNLGVMYDEGRGVDASRDEAIKWWTKAGEQGDIQAQHNLALLYIAGGDGNYEKATLWLKRAADSGSIPSQYSLGRMYGYGFGVEKSEAESFRFVKMAAESGFDKAQYKLGKMYRDGEGTAVDPGEAGRWFQAAAERGHANAQNKVGTRMATGRDGFEKNEVEALMWLILAEQGGNKDAIENRAVLARRLSAGQVQQAEDMAGKWVPRANGS